MPTGFSPEVLAELARRYGMPPQTYLEQGGDPQAGDWLSFPPPAVPAPYAQVDPRLHNTPVLDPRQFRSRTPAYDPEMDFKWQRHGGKA